MSGGPCGVGDCENPRTGIVTNQPVWYDPDRPHYAVSVCGSSRCRQIALGDTLLATGEPGHLIPDPIERAT